MEASLNDDALRELSDDTTFVTPPKVSDDAGHDLVVVADPDAPTVSGEAVASLQNYDVKLVTLEEGSARLHDLDEVTETILAAESISRSDAEHYAGVLGEDFQERLPLNEYTETPSRTNLRETQRFAEVEREKIGEQLIEQFQNFVKTEWTQAAQLVAWIEGPEVDDLLFRLEELGRTAHSDLPIVMASKNFYAPGGDKDMVDVRNHNLACSVPSDSMISLWPNADELLGRLSEVLRSKGFKFLYFLGSRPLLPDLRGLTYDRTEQETTSLTYHELNGVLASGTLNRALSHLREDMSKNWSTLHAAMQTPNLEVLDQNLPMVREFIGRLVTLHRIIVDLQPLPLYGQAVLKLFSDQAALQA